MWLIKSLWGNIFMKKNILEHLSNKCNLTYLSDLHSKAYFSLVKATLHTINQGTFSLDEWIYAYQYIFEEPINVSTYDELQDSIPLTFEEVLEEFHNYINEDDICDVVLTSQGYTVMLWDDILQEWYNVTLCKTPNKLKAVLSNQRKELESYKSCI